MATRARFFKIVAIVILFLVFLQYLYLFPVKLNFSNHSLRPPSGDINEGPSLFNFRPHGVNQKRSSDLGTSSAQVEENSANVNGNFDQSKLKIVSIVDTPNKNEGANRSSIPAASPPRTTPSRISVSASSINTTTKSQISSSNSPSPSTPPVLPFCPEKSPLLMGNLKVSMTHPPSLADIGRIHGDIALGGRFKPPNCTSRHKVAIILPFRDREEHLRIFLYNILPILKRQQLEFNIFVIEQGGASIDEPFNRAMLFNVGFAEANKRGTFDCFIFHDVDLIPENDYNLYNCPVQPRHMSVAVDKMQYKLPYKTIFGGIGAMTKEHFLKVNGFSNSFWGWGGEDDDMAGRIAYNGLYISRPAPNVARYKMIKHKPQKLNNQRYRILRKGKTRYATDGINSLKYTVEQFVLEKTHTLLRVQLQKS